MKLLISTAATATILIAGCSSPPSTTTRACQQYAVFYADIAVGRLSDAEIRDTLISIRNTAAQDQYSALPIPLDMMIDSVTGSFNKSDFVYADGRMQVLCSNSK